MRVALLRLVSTAVAWLPQKLGAEEPSVHARNAQMKPVPAHLFLRKPPPQSDVVDPFVWVYGYLPSWGPSVDEIAWDKLSHVAIFSVRLRQNGDLADTTHWKKIAKDAV